MDNKPAVPQHNWRSFLVFSIPFLLMSVVVSAQANEDSLSEYKARALITRYYNEHGIWAGTYTMKAIKRIRVKTYGNRRAVAHVEYSYEPTGKTPKTRQGTDKRTFLLIKSRDWTVISMGSHKSGKI